jgi:hypothetical protein
MPQIGGIIDGENDLCTSLCILKVKCQSFNLTRKKVFFSKGHFDWRSLAQSICGVSLHHFIQPGLSDICVAF